MKYLLSYPRSGNHLVRFFIELLSGVRTLGCIESQNGDIPIYQNRFPGNIDFDIKTDVSHSECFRKYHIPPKKMLLPEDELICILRNPYEVLLRFAGNDIKSYDMYFDIIDYYNIFPGRKIIFYYEDILNKKEEFIKKLYTFVGNKEDKYIDILQRIEWYYQMSANGKNRAWGGVNSNFQTSYYYKKIDPMFKKTFDKYVAEKIEKYKQLNVYKI